MLSPFVMDTVTPVPIDSGVVKALQIYAPHLAHITHVRLLSNMRSRVVSVQDELVVKYGRNVRQVEADSMRFVSEHTSMPLPKLYGTHVAENGHVFIVMEFIHGQTIGRAWCKLSQEQKNVLALQLKDYLNQMRTLSQSYIGALGQRPCLEDTLQQPFRGPFNDERELNEALVRSYELQRAGHFGSMLKNMLKEGHKIVFSHSDLNMRNILIHEGQIVSVLDWESAGFFPEYWEYAHARLGVSWSDPELDDWITFLETCLKPYPSDAATIEAIAKAWFR